MKYLLIVVVLFFSACSIKNYEFTQTKIITIKSPKLKFADIGYLRNSSSSIELELFVAGKAIEKISVNHLICVSKGCMSKSGFNRDYLNENYPDNILQNILLGNTIYDGLNRVQTQNGFEQSINNEHVQITYRVNPHAIYFKDKKNNIIFKIKDMER
jgi:hypothetical protein